MKNPGWVDLQVNGHNGVDFTNPDLTADEFCRAAEDLVNKGTEIFLPTMITDSFDNYRKKADAIRSAVERYSLQKHVPGLHLEGPFLSGKGIGSHNPAYLQEPTPEKIRELYDICGGFIRILTMSAEIENIAECVAAAHELGIKVSLGHHLAGYAEITRAADAGADSLTHLGNACPNLLGRHENPLLAGLAEERLQAFIITDGHHLPPPLIKLIFKVKGVANIIVTSDASAAAGMKPGKLHLQGIDAVLEPNGKLWNPERNCLVASASTIQMCMDFLESLDILSEEELIQSGRTNALNYLGIMS